MDSRSLKKPTPIWPFVLLLLAAGGAGGWYWYQQSHQPALPSINAAEVAEVQDAGPAAPEGGALPPTEESDSTLRKQIPKLSSNPKVLAWLSETDLVRRVTAAIRAVAVGESPKTSLGFMAPAQGFKVITKHDKMHIDPASFQRYDFVGDAVNSLDIKAIGEHYPTVRGLFESAYREIGEPGTKFESVFGKAIKRLISTPVPNGEIAVKFSTVGTTYEYVDPALESLPVPQKHLLRMGPRNMKLIQAKLTEIATALQIPMK